MKIVILHKEIVSYLLEQGYKCKYDDEDRIIRIEVCVEEKNIELVMKLPKFYPYDFPEVYCYQELDFLMPHVYTNNRLCLFDENEETMYPERHLEIAKMSVERAIKLIKDSILGNNILEYNLEAVSYWNSKAELCVIMLRFDDSYSHYVWAYQILESIYVCADSETELAEFIYKLDGTQISRQDLKKVLFVKSDIVITMLVSKLIDVDTWLIGDKNKKIYLEYMSKNHDSSLIISSFNNTVGNCLLGIKIGELRSNNIKITRRNINGVLRANAGRKFEKIQIYDMRMKRLFTRGGDGLAMFDKKCLFVGGGSVGSYLVKAISEIGISDDITVLDKEVLTSDNIARHLCGANDILSENKAEAICNYMLEQYPTMRCMAIYKNVLEVIQKPDDFFEEYDIVFVAVGNCMLEKQFINLYKQGKIKQCVLVWVEPYLVAGHAIVLNADYTDSTESYIFDEYENFKISVVENSKQYLKSEAGCQSAYAPYAGFELQKFILDFVDLYHQEVYEKEDKANYIINWYGRMRWARQNNIAIKPAYRAIDDRTIKIKRIDVE